MKKINFDELVREARNMPTLPEARARELFADFERRLAVKKTRPRIRPVALFAGLGMSGVLLGALAIFIFIPRVNDGSGSRVMVQNKNLAPGKLKAGNTYVFQKAARTEPVKEVALNFGEATVAKLEARSGVRDSWTLQSGVIHVDNRNTAYKNRIQVGPFVFDEIGTTYVLSKTNDCARLFVEAGIVRISNVETSRVDDVGQGRNWKGLVPESSDKSVGPSEPRLAEKLNTWKKGAEFSWVGRTDLLLVKRGQCLRVDLKSGDKKNEFRLEVPATIRTICFSDEAVAVATHSDFVYFFDRNGVRASARVGSQTAENLFWFNNRLAFVNAEGKLLIYGPTRELERSFPVLTGSLWEGILLSDHILVL
ncbi:MAG: hypothetical protein JNM63_16525, partial [Spirochaetia bacterium]|nr:hypothetical protein [Spirochaetia bacterium]